MTITLRPPKANSHCGVRLAGNVSHIDAEPSRIRRELHENVTKLFRKAGRNPNAALIWLSSFSGADQRVMRMTDQQLAIQAIGEAQLILEEYLQPRPQNNERTLDKLVAVLERPDVMAAVSRLQQRNGSSEAVK